VIGGAAGKVLDPIVNRYVSTGVQSALKGDPQAQRKLLENTMGEELKTLDEIRQTHEKVKPMVETAQRWHGNLQQAGEGFGTSCGSSTGRRSGRRCSCT
jgi:hypothetical protein